MYNVNHLITSKTARYYTLGKIDQNTRYVWVVLHGYGQLAEHFIKKFECLLTPQTYIIAPEGFHRFYLQGHTGRVGASWMTKEDRLNDIKDYVNFLENIYKQISLAGNARLIVLGFSQGVATACRWLEQGSINPYAFVMWAGVFPPDLQFAISAAKLKKTRVFTVYGNNDEFIKPEDINHQINTLKTLTINYTMLQFEGNHTINKETLLKIASDAQNIDE